MKKIVFGMILLGYMMTSCSTSNVDGLAVGKVSNTECQQMSRTRGEDAGILAPTTLVLTREGNNIVGELKNYNVPCKHHDLYVKCNQDGSELSVTVIFEEPQGDNIISSNCSCTVNVYFTIYDIEGDLFHVIIGGRDFGNASFKDGNTVELMYVENTKS